MLRLRSSEKTCRQSAGPPRLSLFYGPCRYGPTTSQKTLKPLRKSGCGPCRSETVSEMKSPTGLFGSPVYLETSTVVKVPASRLNVGPWVIDNLSNRPTVVVAIVTVPACSSITSGDVCLTGPAKESVVDLPLSAVKTPRKVSLLKCVPLPVSRKTNMPRPTVVPEKPQRL